MTPGFLNWKTMRMLVLLVKMESSAGTEDLGYCGKIMNLDC